MSTSLKLENKFVSLIPLKQEHMVHLLEYSNNEPDIWEFGATSAAGINNLKNYIDYALQERDKGTQLVFAIYSKKHKHYVGSTRIYDIDLNHRTAQIGYTWLGKTYQGTGINANCKKLLLQYAFEKLELLRIGFQINSSNVRSSESLKKIGCTFEGILRSHQFDSKGRRRDTAVFSILQEEWFSKVKQKLENLTAEVSENTN